MAQKYQSPNGSPIVGTLEQLTGCTKSWAESDQGVEHIRGKKQVYHSEIEYQSLVADAAE